jgi:hypothetical protein
MEVAVAFTLYFSFAGFLIFPKFNAPPVFGKMAITLCGYEFVLTTWWAATRSSCSVGGDCPPLVDTLRRMAGVEVPSLTGLLFVIAIAYGVFVARNW